MGNLAPLMSSDSDEWCSPLVVLERVRKVGHIRLDPCSAKGSIVGAAKAFDARWGEDGLDASWPVDGLTYVNPPYSQISNWVAKIDYEQPFCEVIALVPARVDTRWFQKCWSATAICFWKGRLKFLGGKSCAPFPSAVVYWGTNKYRFADAFQDAGKVVFP